MNIGYDGNQEQNYDGYEYDCISDRRLKELDLN